MGYSGTNERTNGAIAIKFAGEDNLEMINERTVNCRSLETQRTPPSGRLDANGIIEGWSKAPMARLSVFAV